MNLRQIIQNQNNYSLVRLYESKFERTVVNTIISSLGKKYDLAAASSDRRITDTGGTDPDILATEIGKLLNTEVTVIKPNQEVKWGSGKKEKISSKLYGLHFEYVDKEDGKKKIVNLGISKGSGDPKIPSKAEYYEMGICVEYNKLKHKGITQTKAMEMAAVKPAKYDPYKSYLSEVCSKVVNNMGNVGKSLRQTGGDSFKVAAVWPSSDGTPKTDIYGGTKDRISVKKKGGSQLMSGKAGDAKGVFLGGKAFYEKFEDGSVVKGLNKIIGSIEEDFKTFNTARSVGVIRDAAGADYVKYRVPKINDEIRTINNKNKKKKIALIKLKKGQAEKMAKAEAMAAGIIGLKGNWADWFIEGVPPIDEMAMAQWFTNYVAEQPTDDLREEISDVIATAIDHKRLDGEVNAIFENVEFKKWCVFEAATGTFKFSGEANKNATEMGVANKILVFGQDGSAALKPLNVAWAKKYAQQVDVSISYKTSKRSKSTAMRIQDRSPKTISSGKVPQFSSSAKLLREVKSIVDEEYVDYILNTNYILNEISFGDLKAAGKKIIKNVKSMMTKFYQKVFKRIIDKIKEYAKKGIDTFLDLLGIEINGSSKVSVNF